MTDQLPADYLAEMIERRVAMQRTGHIDELTPGSCFWPATSAAM